LKKPEVREKIIEYATEVDDSFNEIIGDNHLDYALKHFGRNELRTGEPVIVSAREIEKIHTITNIKEQKVLFTMLVISKIFNKSKDKDYYYNGSLSDVFRLSRMTGLSKSERIDIIHSLSKNKYIEPNLRGGYKISIIDQETLDNENDITIVDFDNMSDKFPAVCSICGEQMLGKPKRRTYCDKCYDEKRKKDIRKNVSNFRNKPKSDM
jgi:hypothetical protein